MIRIEKSLNLKGSEFSGSEFSGSGFSGSEFSGSEFSGSGFSGSEFSGSEGGFPLSRNFYVRTDVNFNWLYVRKLK